MEISQRRTKNTQGDYYPYVAIFYKNGSAPTTVDLQDGKVHVFGLDAVEQMEYNERQEEQNRRNIAITVDLGLIAVLVPLAVGVLKVGSKENQGVTNAKQTTQKSKPYQKILRKKSKAKKRRKKKRGRTKK